MLNLTKSIFVASFPAVTMMFTAGVLQNIDRFGVPSALALAVANGVVGGFFFMLMAFKNRARTSAHLHGLTVTVALASGLGVATATSIDGVVWAVAATPLIGWLMYDYWYSSFGERATAGLEVGDSLPSFGLEDEHGAQVSSDSLRGAPALLLFYRGNWCPLCMAQIKEIAGGYKALSDRGVQVVLISPQPHGHTRKLAAKFDVPSRFLVDKGNAAARQLGLDVKFGIPMGLQALGYASETVMPTVLITDAAGTILFADLTDNYRVRPEPETFLHVLDEARVGECRRHAEEQAGPHAWKRRTSASADGAPAAGRTPG